MSDYFAHTGEPGHIWEHQKRRPWPPVELLDDGETQRSTKGALACTGCGIAWPGTEPCPAVAS